MNENRWCYYLILLGVLLCAIVWLNWWEPENDEIEHFHAAWLMHQGQVPFRDFYEHHSPIFWVAIGTYYRLFGENFGVIPVCRAVMILIFALTSFFILNILRFYTRSPGGYLAAFGFPLLNLGLFHASLFVRSDPVILCLLTLALWIAIPITKADRWKSPEIKRLILVFICLSGALSFSPRAGIPVAALFITLAVMGWRSMDKARLSTIIFIGGIMIILPTALLAWYYGIDQFLFWVYRYSATLRPRFSPIPTLIKLIVSAFPLWILALYAIFHILSDQTLRRSRGLILIIIMAIVNFWGLWASTKPYMQHFLMTIPFWGLLAGIGYEPLKELLRVRFKLPNWNWAFILLGVGILFTGGKQLRSLNSGGLETRQSWTTRAEWLIDKAGPQGTAATGTAYNQPIFLDNAFYYWFPGRKASSLIRCRALHFTPYTLENLRKEGPTLLHDSFAEAWGISDDAAYQAWLSTNYQSTPFPGYWIINDNQ
ncbi:MAG: hypothetical protein NTW14_07675 [bacterium]|nr:hypothetical protein [bacterium]